MSDNLNKRLLGLDDSDLVEIPALSCRVDMQLILPLTELQGRAAAAGFCLKVASSYRDFNRQLQIWNNKATGRRTLLDEQGQPLDIKKLSDREKMFAILRWSALPGGSRHHWGTDLDVYDSSRIDSAYQLQLTCEETQGTGPFAPFHLWLTDDLACADNYFYRPYTEGSTGVAPEPWHLSFEPLARQFAQAFTEKILYEHLQSIEFELKAEVLANLNEIYHRFICVN